MTADRDRDRDEKGRVTDTPVYSDEEFLGAIQGQEMPTTTDVARVLGCSRSLASERLRELEEADEVEFVERGNAKLWRVLD